MKRLYFYLTAVISISMLTGCKEPAESKTQVGKETTEVLETTEKNVLDVKDQNTASATKELIETTGPVESAKVDVLLTSAPEISLTDSLSSTLNQFQVQPGSYSWNYKEGKEVTGVVACGLHPLDANMEKSHKLSMPEYKGIDYVSYSVSCVIAPDRLIVREWDVSCLGETETVENSQTVYEDEFFIKLKPNMVYEITAQWDKEKLEDNGFYGEGSYAFITE